MRTLIKFFKKRTPFEIAAFILLMAIGITYTVTRYFDDPENPVTAFASNKIEEYKDKIGEKTAKVETNRQNSIKGVDPAEYERIKRSLGVAEDKILAYTNIEATLRDTLKLTRVLLDEANNKKWEWETVKPSGSVIKATMSEKDSVLHTDVDVKLNTTDYVVKGGIFKKDKFYTDIYSADQNIKINGVKSIRKETYIPPKRFGLGLQVGYGVSNDLKPSLYVGVGISYNLINL